MLPPVTVRAAKEDDLPSLLEIPQYSEVSFPYEEDILVAESNDGILGAISIGQWDIMCVPGEWKNNHENLNGIAERKKGPWVSKLYVFPDYRLRGIGTRLVEAAVEREKGKGSKEIFSGIYIRNRSRPISPHIFEKSGFKEIGSCICPMPKGYCRGTLLKKNLLEESE